MYFSGLQKLSMVDFTDKMCATIFTAGCNFRCPFCHNAALVLPEYLKESEKITEEEIFTFLDTRKKILDGICITGGEPLMHPDLKNFVKKVKEYGYAVKLDTNGSFPDRLKEILEEGNIDYVAMDIKNSPLKYSETVGLQSFDLESICQSIDIIRSSGVDYEFRTTVMKEFHTLEDFMSIGKWLEGSNKYYLQKYRDESVQIVGGFSSYSNDELLEFADKIRGFFNFVQVRGI